MKHKFVSSHTMNGTLEIYKYRGSTCNFVLSEDKDPCEFMPISKNVVPDVFGIVVTSYNDVTPYIMRSGSIGHEDFIREVARGDFNSSGITGSVAGVYDTIEGLHSEGIEIDKIFEVILPLLNVYKETFEMEYDYVFFETDEDIYSHSIWIGLS